ncbi:MAG: glycine cleavage system aminomethyltransferase GcvT [Bacteriovoracaceae bacterium]|nr:glycine cleavage system aminomethyltransferase GcvT [Bacteriovoracaceae bacterium]
MTELKHTSLHSEHLALKARMVPFAGWEMPVQYTSVKEEALAVRKNCGVFDVSHMGEFWIEGEEAQNFIDFMVTNDITSAPEKKAIYSPLCRENGTVIDDLIVYKINSKRFLICVNASNIEKDWNWFQSHVKNFNCSLSNKSEETSLLALQGPLAEKIMLDVGFEDIKTLAYYEVAETMWEKQNVTLARTGYTGEDGFEIFSSHNVIKKIWDLFLKLGVRPCGLAARDLLRTEVCYPLYGHEIHDEVTPLDSALKWTVKLQKEKFLGKSALEKYHPKYQLVKLSLEKGIPRDGYMVENSQGLTIGKVTSGTLSVVIEKGIALAHIEKDSFPNDEKFFINIRGQKYPAILQKTAFVKGGHK